MSPEEKHINETIPLLSRRARTAFAIGCAERTVPLADWYFGPRQRPMFEKAIERCWSFALGETVPESELEALYQHFDALADKLYEKDEDGSPYLFTVLAFLFAIESARQPEGKVTQTSVGYSRGAASGEDAHASHATHTQEEAVWQALAIDVAL